jgi:hypothetical protein
MVAGHFQRRPQRLAAQSGFPASGLQRRPEQLEEFRQGGLEAGSA